MNRNLKEKLEKHRERLKQTKVYINAMERVIKEQRRQIKDLSGNLPKMILAYIVMKAKGVRKI